MRHIAGCGVTLSGSIVTLHVDNVGQVNGTDAATPVTAAGSRPFIVLCGRTAGGDTLPVLVGPAGHIKFTS